MDFIQGMEGKGHLRFVSIQGREGKLALGRLGRCLAFSVATKSFPPRAWRWSNLQHEWATFQGMLARLGCTSHGKGA